MKRFLPFLLIIPLFFVSCKSVDQNLKPDFDSRFSASYPEKNLVSEISFRVYANPDPTFLSKLSEKFPNFTHSQPENSLEYFTYKLKEGGYCYVFFDVRQGATSKFGTCVGAFVVKDYLLKSDFGNLKENISNLTDVVKIDKGLGTLLTSQDSATSLLISVPLVTFHLTADGFVKITYQNLEKERYYAEIQPNLTYEEDAIFHKKLNDFNNFTVSKVEFLQNGDMLFEEVYAEKKYTDSVDFGYKPFKTTLNDSDYPFLPPK
jgi:hypothetical protein